MNKFKEKITLNPVLTFLILIFATILLSGFLNLIGFEATYNKIDLTTGEYVATSESVESLMSLSGIKYIFTFLFGYVKILLNLILIHSAFQVQ